MQVQAKQMKQVAGMPSGSLLLEKQRIYKQLIQQALTRFLTCRSIQFGLLKPVENTVKPVLEAKKVIFGSGLNWLVYIGGCLIKVQ